MSAEQVEQIILGKMFERFHNLHDAFLFLDKGGQGSLSAKDFKGS